MLSEAKIAAYRLMTPEQRWREVEELMTIAWRTLQALPADEFAQRMQVIRDEHESSNRLILERLRSLR